jgi:hypothetical protein
MKISKIHQEFSERLIEPKALTHPEDFLGPNWEDVINLWLYIDGLGEEEMKKIYDRYLALEWIARESAYDIAKVAAAEVVGGKVKIAAGYAAFYVTNMRWVFGDATIELIAHHKLLEQNKTPLALPFCLNR